MQNYFSLEMSMKINSSTNICSFVRMAFFQLQVVSKKMIWPGLAIIPIRNMAERCNCLPKCLIASHWQSQVFLVLNPVLSSLQHAAYTSFQCAHIGTALLTLLPPPLSSCLPLCCSPDIKSPFPCYFCHVLCCIFAQKLLCNTNDSIWLSV